MSLVSHPVTEKEKWEVYIQRDFLFAYQQDYFETLEAALEFAHGYMAVDKKIVRVSIIKHVPYMEWRLDLSDSNSTN